MPQTFNVVRCVACRAFQVQLEKKAKKWNCSMCGEKQSLQRIYGTSNRAKDCRDLVQQYNSARGLVEQEEDAGVEAEKHAPATAEAAAAGAAPAGGWANDEWWVDSDEEGGVTADAPALQKKWSAFQTEGEAEAEGWTVGLPERPAAGGRHGSGAGRAGKRKQQQDGEGGLSRQEDVSLLDRCQEQQQRGGERDAPKKQQQHELQLPAWHALPAQRQELQVGWQRQLLAMQPTNVQWQEQNVAALPRKASATAQQQNTGAIWHSETAAVEAAGHVHAATKQHQQQSAQQPAGGGKWGTFLEDEVDW